MSKEDRRREVEIEGRDPTVLIVSGGHSGLDIPARLKALIVPTPVIEKDEKQEEV